MAARLMLQEMMRIWYTTLKMRKKKAQSPLQKSGKTENKYSVNEENVSGYDSNVVESEETDAAGDGGKVKVFTITNTKTETGSLKVSKTVEGNGADRNKAFKFKVELKNGGNHVSGVYPLDGTAGSKTGTIVFDENGKASFELKHNESIVISGLPIGASYEIAENPYKYYTASDEGKYSGVIPEGTAEVNVVNTHKEMYSISVTKTVKGNQGDKTKQFKFQMSITGNGVPGNLAYAKNGKAGSVAVKNGIAEFTLGHKDVIVFKEVPEGVEYAVTELDGESNGYTVESKNASGTLNKDTEISFVNTKDVGVPTAAMTNTGAIAGVVMAGVIGIMAIVILKRKKRSEK